MNLHPRPRISPLQLLYRSQYPLPHRMGVRVASFTHRVGAHGGTDRRALAVLLHEEVGGAPDVEVGDYLRCTKLTAASASEAVISGRACWTA